MIKINKIKKQKGLTVTELMIVTSLSIFILLMIYQVSKGAMNLFQSTKSNSDTLENKIPAMEILNRYFERWGVSTIFSNPYYISSKTDTDGIYKITFYVNMGGFGFIKGSTTSSIDLISCRLNDSIDPKLIKDSNGDYCYYMYKGTAATLEPTTVNPTLTSLNEDTTYTSLKIHSLSSLTPATSGECISPSFYGDINVNNSNLSKIYNITTTGTTADGVYRNDTSKKATLESGDFIFTAPQKVVLYVKPNNNDKNKKWLYSEVTSVASDCNTNSNKIDPEALAPAESISLDSTTPEKTATITIKFRSDFKGQGSKFFTVTRTFGG